MWVSTLIWITILLLPTNVILCLVPCTCSSTNRSWWFSSQNDSQRSSCSCLSTTWFDAVDTWEWDVYIVLFYALLLQRYIPELSLAVCWQKKANQRLVLYAYQGYYNVIEWISGARQSCARGMPVSTLSNAFCIIQVLEGPQNLSALYRIIRCPHFMQGL